MHTTSMDGSTKSLLNLIRGLREKGVDVYVAGPKDDGSLVSKFAQLGVTYKSVRIKKSFYPIFSFSLRELFGIRYFIRLLAIPYSRIISFYDILCLTNEIKPDVIHSNTGVIREGFWVAKKKNIPHVWHLREYQDKEKGVPVFPSKKLFEKALSKSYVITITDDLQHYFHLTGLLNVRTIYNGIYDADKVDFIWPKKKYLLCATRIIPYKGHDDIIRAFSKFYRLHPEYKLVILGFGTDNWIKSLKKIAEEQKCDNAIIWEGYKENVAEYMKEATGLLVASRYEGFGRMTAEACFSGCIVIGRNNSGTKEIINKTGGFLFDDEDTMCQRMMELSNLSEAQYREMIIQAQNCSRRLFSIQKNVEETYRFYEDILHKNENEVKL